MPEIKNKVYLGQIRFQYSSHNTPLPRDKFLQTNAEGSRRKRVLTGSGGGRYRNTYTEHFSGKSGLLQQNKVMSSMYTIASIVHSSFSST
ncbi:Uncharacterized protein HZ326_18902 [Fusarium oxysporum f. sp. albedinis]|nr:Uncharacterized protein HZ326_18902 [Fusarium oxysporum f. sp. albedinis]